MEILSIYSHTLSGIFWFDLPLGILLAFAFHNIVRNSFIENLPTFFRARFSKFKKFDWNGHFKKNWLVIAISVLIGAFSHIFWDSFTHDHGYFVELIPSLSSMISILGNEIKLLKILQHSSTLIGGMIILLAIYKLPQEKLESESINLKYWGILIGLTALIFTARLLAGLELHQYGNLIVSGISAGLISMILTPIILK